jgi:hypothetical protein
MIAIQAALTGGPCSSFLKTGGSLRGFEIPRKWYFFESPELADSLIWIL